MTQMTPRGNDVGPVSVSPVPSVAGWSVAPAGVVLAQGTDGRPMAKHGADIGTRVETFLGEFRMIIPAMAALLGFQLTMAFSDSFQDLAPAEQVASFAGLACTAAAFLFLLVPASYHRFTLEFEETEEFLRFGRRSIGLAF